MTDKKLYIIAGVVLIIVVLITVLITKTVVDDDDTHKVLQDRNKELAYQAYKARQGYDSLTKLDLKKDKEIDSLKKISVKLEDKSSYFEKELKTIKGRYKGYTSDSLYKELIRRYEDNTGNTININNR